MSRILHPFPAFYVGADAAADEENCLLGLFQKPKYIFLFIGDGMGTAQIQSARFYKGTVDNNGAVTEADFHIFPDKVKPPRSGTAATAAGQGGFALIMLFAFAAPPVKKQIGKVRRLSRFVIWKMIPLNMARAKRRPFKI